MYTYAKNSIHFLMTCFMAGTLVAAPQPASEVDDSGRQHILALMNHAEAQVNVVAEEAHLYAQTQNIVSDLDIPEIVKFFDCKTEVGRWYLQETLSNPFKAVDGVVAQRQQCIRMLVENPEYKKQVDELLQAAHEHEQEAIILLSDFFKGKTCPELKQLEVVKQHNPWMYPFIKALSCSSTGRSLSFCCSLLGHGFLNYSLYNIASDYYRLIKQYGYANVYAAAPFVAYILPVYYVFMESFNIYGSYKDYSTGAEKRTKIHALNQLMHISEQFEELAQKASVTLQNKFSVQAETDASGMIDGVKASRYKDKKSYLFAVPLVHTFLYKLYEQEHQLAPLFASIAEIDAYNAIATKMLETQAQQNKFCFATVIDSEKPAVETAGFWNVLVKKPVVNSISETQNIVLTGPNAGGKTTSIRALLQNIVLAQTYGVAAAEQFACTPFEVIHSYLNVSDDLINGLSLFASEVKRAQGIVETIKNLQPNEKYFCALDELFTGTVAEDGEVCAYQFVKRITQCDSALFIYATHFGKLTTLEADNIGCINYKVDAPSKDANGHLVYPYTLNCGINDARVALDLANQANLFA
jgi:hypothetical protein